MIKFIIKKLNFNHFMLYIAIVSLLCFLEKPVLIFLKITGVTTWTLLVFNFLIVSLLFIFFRRPLIASLLIIGNYFFCTYTRLIVTFYTIEIIIGRTYIYLPLFLFWCIKGNFLIDEFPYSLLVVFTVLFLILSVSTISCRFLFKYNIPDYKDIKEITVDNN